MTQQTQQDALDRLRKAVADEKDALAAARAALAGAAQQIRDSVDDSAALNELADSLEDDDLADAIVENTSADPSAAQQTGDAANDGGGSAPHPESRAGAAAAGGYDAPQRPPVGSTTGPASGTVADTDAAAAAEGETVDSDDGDRITSQDGRVAAGPFTGTGNQDALRTSGRLGGTDAHAADQRTVEEGADERTQEEGNTSTGDDGSETVDEGSEQPSAA